MSVRQRPFQAATIDAAVASLTNAIGSRRFLVADEVGLGKTVVARGVVQQLSEGRRTPLVVYYVTNGQRVAHQNRGRLVDFLPEEDRSKAISPVDRLGLIPLKARPKGRVALYALTPGTSFPGKTSRLHAGRKEERAFIAAMLGRALPRLIARLPRGVLKGAVTAGWDDLVARHRTQARDAPRAMVRAFRAALRTEFDGDPRKTLPAAAKALSAGRFVGRLRRALAHAVLMAEPPDLVVFDEFQRYRDLISPEGRKDRLVATMLAGGRARAPAVLLLSATPYKLYASRWDESRGVEAHREFFDLVAFLAGTSGEQVREATATAFAAFGGVIRSLATADGSKTAERVADAGRNREALQSLLAPLMSRTERGSGRTDDTGRTTRLEGASTIADIHAFRHLVQSFHLRHRGDALPYWLSVPLPAQALGRRYQAWNAGRFAPDAALVSLSASDKGRLRTPVDWPHPKLRALRKLAAPANLALPWSAPSQPWWPLAGGWTNASPDKILLFSRFKATPQSVAALTSLDVERTYLAGDRKGYDHAWRRRRLQAGPGRMPLMALFHPSPFLVGATDPLLAARRPISAVRTSVRRQLAAALAKLGVKVKNATASERARHRATWSLIAGLDALAGFSEKSAGAWADAAKRDTRLATMVAAWHEAPAPDWIGPREFDDLANAALGNPGVIAARSLRRHDGGANDAAHLRDAVLASWSGLRLYLDNPVFHARLKGATPLDAIRRASVEGGLEALLDEHFWTLAQSSPSGAASIAATFADAVNFVTGSFGFHPLGAKSKRRIRIRCHAAVPFGGSEEVEKVREGEKRPARSDELRMAFNAPFWPYVLATTSVGQEGLDFHTWCSQVAHWDLCSSPLDLEQREGRVQRFAGLGVRRQLARQVGAAAMAEPRDMHASLWTRIATIADERLGDRSGLSPWWVLPGGEATRYVFDLLHGRDAARFERLQEMRLIYRLALGQPNQEDLIDLLLRSDRQRLDELSHLTLDLSAFGRSQPISAGTGWKPADHPVVP